ncbi:methyltransferase [Flavobacterium kingsejongi]|uniref:Methyltransferase n=1 Tax=Flavobacterium kingsejongi TaxID=1678728 RepID=A0A2S1LLB0_9FLAO|nr:class I SAM-dependent methyltransferase [Flavobacterium kingsejongi]AWG24534.1 methyltransferase [Flavobacterium kingsejongi]
MDATSLKPYLSVTDFSVSKEQFELYHNETLDMLITTPQPMGAELAKYYESEDYISHTDGKRSFFEKIYHFIKNIALKNKRTLINSYHTEKGRILDIGAGTGDFLSYMLKDGWDAVGIEPNEKAKNSAVQKGVSFVSDLSELEDDSFDVITMWHVLEHVPNPDNQIIELKRLLKKGGSLFVAVPNFNSYDAKHYGKYWAAFDVPRHLWHFSKTAIRKLFALQHMEVIKILPMKFDAYYVSLLSEKYKNGKMNFFQAFITGWRSNRKAKEHLEYSSHIYIIKNE